MPIFGQDLGQLSGNAEADLKKVLNYIAYMKEQIEFNDANIKRRLSALEKEGSE